MRRDTGGALPAVVLTVLASLGVVALFVAATPSLREHVPVLSAAAEKQPPRQVGVTAIPSPAPAASTATRPTSSVSPSRLDVPTATASRTTRPSLSAGPSRPPATTRPSPSTAPATAARCKAGSAAVTAVAATYVDQAAPTDRFGAAHNLAVAGRDKSRNRRALVRFTLPAVPSGCTLRSATLTLTAKDATGRRVVVNRAGKAWSESTATWASAPAPAGSAVSATVSGTQVSWTVTGQVATMRSAGNHGFVLRDAAEGSSGEAAQSNFAGRTARHAPVLTLRWG